MDSHPGCPGQGLEELGRVSQPPRPAQEGHFEVIRAERQAAQELAKVGLPWPGGAVQGAGVEEEEHGGPLLLLFFGPGPGKLERRDGLCPNS
jgi:hypothetical protein